VTRFLLALLALLAAAATAAHAQGGAAAGGAAAGGWEQLAGIITSPWVTIALLTVGCLLLFIELLTLHTWGLTGTLGVLAVGLVFAAHVTVGTAGWIGVVLFLAGLTFLLLETHVFPGHGIAAVAGLLLLFLGMFWALGGSENAVFALAVSTILTVLSVIGFFAYLPKSPVWKTLGQQMQQRASLGYVTSESRMHFLGREGRAATVLRPAGLADIDGVRLDVVTEGEFLDAGTPVVVIKVEGSRVVVDNVETPSASGAGVSHSQAA
jgi:membrane-bound serine protease (ClpP class)